MHAPRHADDHLTNADLAPVPLDRRTWNLWSFAALSGYIFTWLLGYSALPGPIAGILIADHFVIRKCHLDIEDLYRADGIYRYHDEFSFAGIGAFVLAVPPNLPGFLVQVKLLDGALVPDFLETLYHQAWFVGFGLAFVLYLAFRKTSPAAIES